MTRIAGYLCVILVLASGSVRADDLLMARSAQQFPEAMNTLQNSIRAHGYTLSRVQRVDIGLSKSGYETDKYRVVFFGKPEQIDRITAKHPRMAAYLPLKIAIFAEGDETLVAAVNPARFGKMFPASELDVVFTRWRSDLESIFDDVREAG